MPVVGDIHTMPLVELLQWVASNKKTGLLELERNKIHKQISFRQGRVVGCFDDDPSMRLGQFLISRGKIDDPTLQLALRRQGAAGGRIPEILVEMGALTKDEIAEQVKLKALETIYGLFEWSAAIFRFEQECVIDRYEIAIDLSVEQILLEGATREDELGRIRERFCSSGIVLQRTDLPVQAGDDDDALKDQLMELIDGKHSLAEILAHAHASEYHVLRLLFGWMQSNNVEIIAERPVDTNAATLVDVRTDNPSMPAELHVMLGIAADKLESGDDEGAMAILDACYKARPHDESLRQQMARTETACLENLAHGPLQPQRIPQRTDSAEEHVAGLQPDQLTVLNMIDGNRAIQSLLWIAPLREIQVLRALRQLLELGLIRLVETGEVSPIEDPDAFLAAAIDDKVANVLDFEDHGSSSKA